MVEKDKERKKKKGPKKLKRKQARPTQTISQKVTVNIGKGQTTKRRTGTQAKRSVQPQQVVYQNQPIPLMPDYSAQLNELRNEVKSHLSSVNKEDGRRRALDLVSRNDIESELRSRGINTTPPSGRPSFLNKPASLTSRLPTREPSSVSLASSAPRPLREPTATAFSNLRASVSELTQSVSDKTAATEQQMPGTQRRASSATADFEPVSQPVEPVDFKPANKMGLMPNVPTPVKRGRGRPSKASLAAQDPAQYTIAFGREEL